MKPQPKLRVQGRAMAYRITHEPPDDPWADVAAIAWSIALLLLIVVLAGVVPAVPAS